MKATIHINGKKVEFKRNWFTGTFTYSVDGKKKSLASALNPSTHFSIELSRAYEAKVGETIITVIKTRPLVLAGVKPHNYKFFLNNELIKEVEEI